MTKHEETAAAALKATGADFAVAADQVADLVAGSFARARSRAAFADLLVALVSGLARINCWTLAQRAGHARPDRLQNLLSRAAWDHEASLAAVGAWAAGELGAGAGAPVVLALD